jgi:type I restriction enzyme S subunit
VAQRVGGAQPNISQGIIRDTRIPLPPLPEQRRIAAILDEADALRRKRREALTLLDDLLRATFVEMFGDPVTNPRGWPEGSLAEVLDDIQSGWSPNCEGRPARADEWGVLKLGAVTTGRFIEDHKALPSGVEPAPELEVRTGDLLFTRKNTPDLVAAVAYVRRVRPRLMIPDLVFRLRLRGPAVHPAYLWQCLMHPAKRGQVQALAAGSSGSMPGVSKAKLLTVRIPLPSRRAQLAFCEWLDGHDESREAMVVHLGETEALFSSLLHRAFTGTL